jgi:hypothetical protein
MQGLICSPLVLGRGVAVAVGCGCDSRIRGRIDLWLFVPLVIVLSIVGEFIALDIQDCFFTRICC